MIDWFFCMTWMQKALTFLLKILKYLPKSCKTKLSIFSEIKYSSQKNSFCKKGRSQEIWKGSGSWNRIGGKTKYIFYMQNVLQSTYIRTTWSFFQVHGLKQQIIRTFVLQIKSSFIRCSAYVLLWKRRTLIKFASLKRYNFISTIYFKKIELNNSLCSW